MLGVLACVANVVTQSTDFKTGQPARGGSSFLTPRRTVARSPGRVAKDGGLPSCVVMCAANFPGGALPVAGAFRGRMHEPD